MSEAIINVNTLPEHLIHRMNTDKVRVREENSGIFVLIPVIDIKPDDAETLWDDVKGLYGIIPCDIDEKTELAQAREEKYGCIS